MPLGEISTPATLNPRPPRYTTCRPTPQPMSNTNPPAGRPSAHATTFLFGSARLRYCGGILSPRQINSHPARSSGVVGVVIFVYPVVDYRYITYCNRNSRNGF